MSHLSLSNCRDVTSTHQELHDFRTFARQLRPARSRRRILLQPTYALTLKFKVHLRQLAFRRRANGIDIVAKPHPLGAVHKRLLPNALQCLVQGCIFSGLGHDANITQSANIQGRSPIVLSFESPPFALGGEPLQQENGSVMKRLFWILVFFSTPACFAQNPPAPMVSPEVHEDHRVTFRFRAPNAKEVAVSLEGAAKDTPMQKDDQSVWSITTDPLAPDFYGYSFVADGVRLIDPSNYLLKPNILSTQSQVHVPGPASLPWEINDVPHGEVHHHFYKSGVVGDQRDFYVYTPPGYDPRSKQDYPVLYLLHGFSDDASGWTAVGRAHVILDNLIAQHKAKPMLMVMPLGYGAPEILHLGFGAFRHEELRDRNFSKFEEALLTEVIPEVEAAYLIRKDRNSRAIAGLSMGGAESLLTGLTSLDKFAWIGAFSSGGIPEDFDKAFAGLDAKANSQLRLLWIACGTEDRLIEINRRLRGWLDSKGVHHTDLETPGMHTWMVWRRNLAAFTSLLFQ
jgi:enterochelin esterase-like enzyme